MTDINQQENLSPNQDGGPTGWYVVKQPEGHCEILGEIVRGSQPEGDCWGPYGSQGEAIAKRVGLIRSGKCRPV